MPLASQEGRARHKYPQIIGVACKFWPKFGPAYHPFIQYTGMLLDIIILDQGQRAVFPLDLVPDEEGPFLTAQTLALPNHISSPSRDLSRDFKLRSLC